MPNISFVLPSGERRLVDAPLGLSIMEISKKHDFALEAACGGSMACATCHIVVAREWFDRLTPASEDEEAVLDVAFGIQSTSRLGCQIKMTPELNGLEVAIVSLHQGEGFGQPGA